LREAGASEAGYLSSRRFPLAKVRRLTDTGRAFDAAISPDGKFVAYQTDESGKFSLWLLETDTGGRVEIVPAITTWRSGLIFSPVDGHVYFISPDERNPAISDLYRVTILGGQPEKILTGIDSPVSFSPDGKKLTYCRSDLANGQTYLMVADLDGSEASTIATRKAPDSYSAGKRPAWSPDGRSIAVVGRNKDENFLRVFIISVSDGSERAISVEKWVAVQDISWLPDSENLFVTAQDDRNFGPLQFWRISTSGSPAEKVSQGLESYVGSSMSRDGRNLVTSLTRSFNTIWMIDGKGGWEPRQIVSNKGGGRMDLAWTPEGRLVFVTNSDGNTNLFSINADGSDQRQLTSDRFDKRSPAISPDGKTIVFISSRNGPDQLWAIGVDGGEQRQLGTAQVYRAPQFSADGKTVIYCTWKDGKAFVWRTALTGGEPQLIKEALPFTPIISPDSRLMAYVDKGLNGSKVIRVTRLIEGSEVKTFDVPASTFANSIAWTPDSKSLIYQFPDDHAINFWQQSLGTEPKKITDFASDYPPFCAWNLEMSKLACVRTSAVRDIVLFSE
jgi:Tol biopolymer transport system component